ncbi:MAG: putative MFS family arabinose efflux permease [Halieaceae bacterium]|jgi:predicted MFS family arabinose efflux permease
MPSHAKALRRKPMPNTPLSPWKQLADNDQFRWLFAGNTAMFFGFFSTLLLRSLLAWDLTQDEMTLAYINLVTAIAMFITSLFSGAIIDRLERRMLMFVAQLVVFFAESLTLYLLVTGQLTFGYLVFSALIASVAFPFIMPARTAMLVDAVGKSPLAKATALVNAGINIARMISPAALGFLVDAKGFVYGYLFLVSLHFISLVCTLGLRKYPPGEFNGQGFFIDLIEGFSYIANNRCLAMTILFGVLPMLVVIPLQNLMVVFVDQIWDAEGSGLGIMMAAMGIGGLLGSVQVALLRDNQLMQPMVIGTLVMAVFLLIFSHTSNFKLAVVLVMLVYSFSAFSQALVQTAVQLMTDDYIRGRVTTITMMSFSLAPMGTIPLAYASKHLGADWAMTIASVLLILSVILIWGLSPAFRNIDTQARV